MADLLDVLKSPAAELILGAAEAKAAESVDDLFDAGRAWIEENLDASSPEAEAAAASWTKLEEVKPHALRLGKAGLALTVGMLAAGDEDDAQRLYIAHEATQAERDAWIERRGDEAVDDAAERSLAWANFKAGAVEALSVGGEVFVRVLLGGLGL